MRLKYSDCVTLLTYLLTVEGIEPPRWGYGPLVLNHRTVYIKIPFFLTHYVN